MKDGIKKITSEGKSKNEMVEVVDEFLDGLKKKMMSAVNAEAALSILIHNSYAPDQGGELQMLGTHCSLFIPVGGELIDPNKDKVLLVVKKDSWGKHEPVHQCSVVMMERKNGKMVAMTSESMLIEDYDMSFCVEARMNYDTAERHFTLWLDRGDVEEPVCRYEGVNYKLKADWENMTFKIEGEEKLFVELNQHRGQINVFNITLSKIKSDGNIKHIFSDTITVSVNEVRNFVSQMDKGDPMESEENSFHIMLPIERLKIIEVDGDQPVHSILRYDLSRMKFELTCKMEK